MKMTSLAVFAAFLCATSLSAQNPTWAEQLHKTKTGAWPPGVEKRLKAEKEAREQRPQVQAADLFALLDHNHDGTISAQEWQLATESTTPAPKQSR